MRTTLTSAALRTNVDTSVWLRSGTRGLAARAPRVRQLEREKQSSRHPEASNLLRKNADAGYSWPTAMLNAAWKAGGLSMPPVLAKRLLDDFSELRAKGKASSHAVEDLLKGYNVKADVLPLIAMLLLRERSQPGLTAPAKQLLVAASHLQNEAASMFLFDQALRNKDPFNADVAFAKENVRRMSDANNVPAMILWARFNELESEIETALKLAEDAADYGARATSAEYEAYRAHLMEAWEIIARLKERLGDRDGAKKALESAALKFDSPMAYFLLATRHREEIGDKCASYILKAAASGVGAAAFELGKQHFRAAKIISARDAAENASQTGRVAKSASLQKQKTEEYAFALEWLYIAMNSTNDASVAVDKDAISLLYLASLYDMGNSQGCLNLISEVASPSLKVQVLRLEEKYRNDSDGLTKGLASILADELESKFGSSEILPA